MVQTYWFHLCCWVIMAILLRKIDLHSSGAEERRPKYQRVCDHLYSEVRAGRLAPGQALPPEAKLSEILGVSRGTLRQALGKMEDDGMLERVQGRGTFLTSEQQRESRRKRDALAFITPEIREDVYPSLIQGFEQGCAGAQHQMVVCKSSNDIARQADLLMQLIDQEVGGVALVPATVSPTPAYQLNLLQKLFVPVVCCHRTVPGIKVPSVIFSGVENGQKAGRALVERGHRHIAYMFSHRYSMVDEREAGLRSALAGHPDAASCQLQLEEYGAVAPPLDAAARAAIGATITRIMSQPNRPTAIFCGSMPEAEQIYLSAQEQGWSIPGDVSLVAFGSTWRDGALSQRIACVHVNEHEIGVTAARLLYEMRTGERAIDNTQQIVSPTSLFVGETLGNV
jgi:GntR family transcriptional regulator, arabinose operon transcriptional repressor